MTIKVTAHHEKFIDAASKLFPGQSEFSVSQIKRIVSESGCPRPGWLIKPKYRVGHGTYSLELAGIQAANVVELPTSIDSVPYWIESSSVNVYDILYDEVSLSFVAVPIS